MRKEKVIIFLCCMATMNLCGCAKDSNNDSSSTEVQFNVDVNQTEDVSQIEEMTQSVQQLDNSDIVDKENVTEDSNKNQNNIRTVLSDTGVQPPERNFLPEGVAPEFMYFNYEDKNVGPYKAQEYLENIGFSVENERLVVLWKQERRAAQIAVDVYDFTTTPVTKISYYFLATPKSLESTISDFGEDNIAFSDVEANYCYSIPMEMDDYYSYEYCLNLFDCDYLSIIW